MESKSLSLERRVFALVPDIDPAHLTEDSARRAAEFVTEVSDLVAASRVSEERARCVTLLLRFVRDWLMRCEQELFPMPTPSPVELLRALMNQDALGQRDLEDVFGHQSTVSLVLAGKRRITADQAQLLARRFAMRADAFLELPKQPSARTPPPAPVARLEGIYALRDAGFKVVVVNTTPPQAPAGIATSAGALTKQEMGHAVYARDGTELAAAYA